MINRKKASPKAITKTRRGDFYESVVEILRAARTQAHRAVNFAMVEAYWTIGRMIVEEEQRGETRAGYGTQRIARLSERLCSEFGRGFSVQSLWNMRQFYQCFPILSALRRELTWTHYKALIRVESESARSCYLQEVTHQNWSVRALERQIHSLYYERLLMTEGLSLIRVRSRRRPAGMDGKEASEGRCGTPSDERADTARRADGPVPPGAGGGRRIDGVALPRKALRTALLRSGALRCSPGATRAAIP